MAHRGCKPMGFRTARTCYDHLAGKLGVAITESLLAKGVIRPAGRDFLVTPAGERWLTEQGIDVLAVRKSRRKFAYGCCDLTERRPHLAGALGAAICRQWLDKGWIARKAGTRELEITPLARAGIETWIKDASRYLNPR